MHARTAARTHLHYQRHIAVRRVIHINICERDGVIRISGGHRRVVGVVVTSSEQALFVANVAHIVDIATSSFLKVEHTRGLYDFGRVVDGNYTDVDGFGRG